MNRFMFEPLKKKISKPTQIATFDIETINWSQQYALGFYDGVQHFEFKGQYCVHEFLKFVCRKKYRNYVIFAHNGGKFDFAFLLDTFTKDADFNQRFEVTPIRIGGRITELKVIHRDKNGKYQYSFVFRDSVTYFKSTLEDLAKQFDVEVKKGEFDHTKISWKNWLELLPEWSPYLEADCISLWQSLRAWEDKLIKDFGVRLKENTTLPQLAMRVFRLDFLKDPIMTYRACEDEIRQSYVGGRTEIFRRYGENLRYYDVNSLYPHAMRNFASPVGSPCVDYAMTVDDFGVVQAFVTPPKDIHIPLLAHKTVDAKGNPKTLFPRYSFEGWFCTPELQKARELGYKIEIKKGFRFEKKFLFTEYVDTFYDIKQTSTDPVEKANAKLFLNSLYGKFGQRREQKKLSLFPKDVLSWTLCDHTGNLQLYEKEHMTQSNHILPAIASFITCHARLTLYEYMEEVQAKGGNVYYCDTDSIICDVELDTDANALGAMKDELSGDIMSEAYFLLPKTYAYRTAKGKESLRCKGFPQKVRNEQGEMEQLFTFDIIKEAVLTNNTEKIVFEQTQLASPMESVRRNKQFVSMVDVKRSLKQFYNKRIVCDDNVSTVPLDTPLHIDTEE